MERSEEKEEMKLTRLRWMLLGCCLRPENSFWSATVLHAVTGLILSVIRLLLGSVGTFIIGAFAPDGWVRRVVLGTSNAVTGVLLLLYSGILLYRVRQRKKFKVFKWIKIGCLVLTSLELGSALILFSLAAYFYNVVALVGFLAAIVSTVAIYGIATEKTFIISANFYLHVLLTPVFIVGGIMGLVIFSVPVLTIDYFVFIISWIYFLNFYVLHLNVVNINSKRVEQI